LNKHLTAIAVAAMVLQGCAKSGPPPQAMEDFNIGIAKSCTATPIDLSAGAAAAATITQTNDGWCAVRTKEKDGKPYKYGLLKVRPAHGYVVIQQMGGETRLEYSAMTRYVGPDAFTVALVSRDPKTPDAAVTVTVNTTMGENMAPPPAAAPAPAAKTSKPAAKKP
jgi:hypothetical protein